MKISGSTIKVAAVRRESHEERQSIAQQTLNLAPKFRCKCRCVCTQPQANGWKPAINCKRFTSYTTDLLLAIP